MNYVECLILKFVRRYILLCLRDFPTANRFSTRRMRARLVLLWWRPQNRLKLKMGWLLYWIQFDERCLLIEWLKDVEDDDAGKYSENSFIIAIITRCLGVDVVVLMVRKKISIHISSSFNPKYGKSDWIVYKVKIQFSFIILISRSWAKEWATSFSHKHKHNT